MLYVMFKRMRDLPDTASAAKIRPQGFSLDVPYPVIEIFPPDTQREIRMMLVNDVGEFKSVPSTDVLFVGYDVSIDGPTEGEPEDDGPGIELEPKKKASRTKQEALIDPFEKEV